MRSIHIIGLARGKYYALKNEDHLVTATEKGGVLAQYRAKSGVLYYRKGENTQLPEHMGWATAKMQEIGR